MRRCLCFAVVLSLVSSVTAGELVLVRDGQAVASILVASDAPKPEQFAAQELRDILATMSGARPPIVNKLPGNVESLVAVGAGAARMAGKKALAAAQLDAIKNDGYAVAVVADNKPACLVLAGKMPRGTLYAVYDFLESHAGCGFFPDGDSIPRQRTVSVRAISSFGNPVFRIRSGMPSTRFLGPKRFNAALWAEEDWKSYLRWMAKKKLNCLGMALSPADGNLGAVFDKAFPEAKPFRKETLPREIAAKDSKYTSRAGWTRHPDQVTALQQQILAYARETLGFETQYIISIGAFEPVLRLAMPKLKWLPTASTALPPAAQGRTACLDMSDPKWRDVQVRLLKSIIKTYGKADYYAVTLTSQTAPGKAGAPGPDIFAKAIAAVKAADADARPAIGTWGADRWGEKPKDKTEFLGSLPEGTGVLYFAPDFSVESFHVNLSVAADTIYRATRQFADRPYIYASPWGGGPANDLFEHRFGFLRNQFRHFDGAYWPKTVAARAAKRRNTIGYTNWNTVRNVNAMMDNLSSEFAWTGLFQWRGEGAHTNPILRRYLSRRYGKRAVYKISDAYKQLFRGAPRAGADANYRAYARNADAIHGQLTASRAAVALAVACKDKAKDSPFYEKDLVDFGRNYIHQLLSALCDQVLEQVAAAKAGKANADAKKTVKTLSEQILAAHKTLIRLLATRKDMSLDDAILEAAATEGANKSLDRIVREQQSGLYLDGFCLVDSLEYHSQLKAKQIANFLKYAEAQMAAPTKDAVPDWKAFFQFGAPDFVEKTKTAPYDGKAEKTAASDILTEYLKIAP